MSRYTLGKKDCQKCKGEGTIPGTPRRIERVNGPPLEYPTVIRCSCLEKPIELTPEDLAKNDAAKKAAGDSE